MTIDLSDTFTPHPSLAAEIVDGEAVLLQLEDGIYYGLDFIGTQAWRLLARGDSLSTAIRSCAAQFPAEAEGRIAADLTALARSLVESRLLSLNSRSGR